MDICAGQQQKVRAHRLMPVPSRPQLIRWIFPDASERLRGARGIDGGEGLRIVLIIPKQTHYQVAPVSSPCIPPQACTVDLDRRAIMAVFIQHAAP